MRSYALTRTARMNYLIIFLFVGLLSLTQPSFALTSDTPPVQPITEQTATNTPQHDTNTVKTNNSSDKDIFNLINTGSKATTNNNSNTAHIDDPLQSYNRFVYSINDSLDVHIAQPVARIYLKIIPRPLTKGIDNVYKNIRILVTTGNDLLQFNFYQATSDSWRLLINTTVGVGGLFDPASKIQLEPSVQDFGLTLARWGWTDSSYFVIPILGPSTLRDAGGKLIDYNLSVYPWIRHIESRNALYVGQLLNDRVQLMQYQNLFDQAAIDPYVFMRNAYLQRRAYLIEQNNTKPRPYTTKETRTYHAPEYLYQ